MLMSGRSYVGSEENRYLFNGKELQSEWGVHDFGARMYDPSLGRWMSTDPLADQFPAWTPYHFVHDNPINLIDPDGRAAMPPSTHVDENGQVVSVKDDGNLGVYMHSKSDIASGNLDNGLDKQVGVTLYEKSFKAGDKIFLRSYRARDWLNTFENTQEMMIASQPIGLIRKGLYAINARNGEVFDPKSYMKGGIGGGSQLSAGVYISNSDLGNYAAGAFARISGYDKQSYLAETGAFAISRNNLSNFIKNHSTLLELAYSHKSTDGAFQRTYGEDDRSNYFIRLGYENIRTLQQFNANFSTIFYDDNRNYKTDVPNR